MTASFWIVFVSTVTQFVVVSWPLKYSRFVTKKNVLVTVAVIYLYTAAIWCLPLMGLSSNVHHMVELFVHEYFLLLTTIAFYILLHRAMRKKMAAGLHFKLEKHIPCYWRKTRANVTELYPCKCSTSYCVDSLFPAVDYSVDDKTVHWRRPVTLCKDSYFHLMVDNLLYLKFLLDAFDYAWRMPKYRESFSKIVYRKISAGNGIEMEMRAS